MFDHIIVGVDGRDSDRDALALAQRLGSSDAEITLAHIYLGELYPWRGSSAAYDSAERQDTEQLLARIRDEIGLSAEIRAMPAASPGQGLHDLAESTEADLIVVGSSRRSLLGRVFVGDRTRAALNGAPCAVAIAPAGLAAESAHRGIVGVGYDGSAESEHALLIARELADGLGARLAALQVVAIPERYVVGPAFPDRHSVHEMLGRMRESMQALGALEARTAWGDPAEELALFSADCDLLVVGSRSYGPIGRLMHGSTSQHLAHSARCPLLVLTRAVRRPGDAEAARSALAAQDA
jgi:nucleotide-binding universal stress UspA family protein